MVGQEHVTTPLVNAVDGGRINHAYLFSGPRGCGKTSSARILARSLNCEQGPDLHAVRRLRVLRRAGARRPRLARRHRDRRGQPRRRRRRPRPARTRLLRPGQQPLQGLHRRRGAHGHHAGLQRPAQGGRGAAGVPRLRLRDDGAGQGAAHHPVAHPPLPVPAGPADHAARAAGEDLRGRGRAPSSRPSSRWSCAPAAARCATRCRSSTSCWPAPGPRASPTRRAVGLLGVTDDALLDETIDALAAHDAPAVFRAVDRVVEAGHDPRRFATDLLDRLRDLIVLDAVPDAGGNGLLDCPPDRLDLMSSAGRRPWARPRSRAWPTPCTRASPRCAGRRRRGCCSSWSAPACCCRPPTARPRPPCSGWSGWSAGCPSPASTPAGRPRSAAGRGEAPGARDPGPRGPVREAPVREAPRRESAPHRAGGSGRRPRAGRTPPRVRPPLAGGRPPRRPARRRSRRPPRQPAATTGPRPCRRGRAPAAAPPRRRRGSGAPPRRARGRRPPTARRASPTSRCRPSRPTTRTGRTRPARPRPGPRPAAPRSRRAPAGGAARRGRVLAGAPRRRADAGGVGQPARACGADGELTTSRRPPGVAGAARRRQAAQAHHRGAAQERAGAPARGTAC